MKRLAYWGSHRKHTGHLLLINMKAAINTHSTTRAPFAVLLSAAAVSAGLLLIRGAGSPATESTRPAAPALAMDTQSQINRLQAQMKDGAGRADDFAQLGWLMLQRTRENGDPDLYARAEKAFAEALQRNPAQVDALLGQGALALSRHAFADAIEWGRKALVHNPYRAQAYGVIGDGQLELGRYGEAAQTIQKMVDLRPDIASYSRVSYVRELNGDMPGAIDAMSRAVVAGNPGSEARAWAQVQLGLLHFDRGDLTRAEVEFNGVLSYLPNYPHALAALARIRNAQGNTSAAIQLYERALKLLPVPEHAQALGEIHMQLGQANQARAQFDLARTLYTLGESGGTDVTLERARFETDHGDAAKALTLARAAHLQRATIHSADALAWALHRNGRHIEAAILMRHALRLNTQDAMLHFHAGMIDAARGETASAKAHLSRALALNPHFSPAAAAEARAWLRAHASS